MLEDYVYFFNLSRSCLYSALSLFFLLIKTEIALKPDEFLIWVICRAWHKGLKQLNIRTGDMKYMKHFALNVWPGLAKPQILSRWQMRLPGNNLRWENLLYELIGLNNIDARLVFAIGQLVLQWPTQHCRLGLSSQIWFFWSSRSILILVGTWLWGATAAI